MKKRKRNSFRRWSTQWVGPQEEFLQGLFPAGGANRLAEMLLGIEGQQLSGRQHHGFGNRRGGFISTARWQLGGRRSSVAAAPHRERYRSNGENSPRPSGVLHSGSQTGICKTGSTGSGLAENSKDRTNRGCVHAPVRTEMVRSIRCGSQEAPRRPCLLCSVPTVAGETIRTCRATPMKPEAHWLPLRNPRQSKSAIAPINEVSNTFCPLNSRMAHGTYGAGQSSSNLTLKADFLLGTTSGSRPPRPHGPLRQ